LNHVSTANLLEKTEGAIQNESSRATYNIGHTRHRTIKKTKKTTNKTNKTNKQTNKEKHKYREQLRNMFNFSKGYMIQPGFGSLRLINSERG
jgi:hypothetical protein